MYTFTGSGKGLVEDFSSNPFVKYDTSGNGELYWDSDNERLVFKHIDIPQYSKTHYDIEMPVDSFSDGFLAIDVISDWRFEDDLMSKSIYDPTMIYCNIWFGFDNGNDSGYGMAFDVAGGITFFKYNGTGYTDVDTIALVSSHPSFWPAGCPNDNTYRLIFGKLDSSLFAFYNNDCIYHTYDTDLDDFNRLKIRLKNRPSNKDSMQILIDNIVFHSQPSVVADFINVLGETKQTQIFDGDRIKVQGYSQSLDMLGLASYKPIDVDVNTNYYHKYGKYLRTSQDHRSPFDLIENYLVVSSIADWSPGDHLDDTSYIYTFYDDTSGTADCWNEDSSRLCPYEEYIYELNPFRRPSKVRSPGLFRDHYIEFEYGHSEDTIAGFDQTYYDSGMVYKEKTIDENANVTVVYKDKMGGVIGIVGDFADSGGVNTYTRFYPNFLGIDTLIIQPDGHHIRRQYNNLGWLMADSSGDYGLVTYLYDRMGNLKFKQTASDRDSNHCNFYIYDNHDRLTYEGLFTRFADLFMFWEYANAPLEYLFGFPWVKVTAEYEYDEGEFGRGLMTKAVRRPSGDADSASYEEFVYDEYGRVIQKDTYVHLVDDSVRTIQAEYNNRGDLTRLVYPNSSGVNYYYDHAGQLRTAIDDDSTVKAEYSYWPGGMVKQKVLGLAENGGPAQYVDYEYNARDWLTSINGGSVTSYTTGSDDHFSLELTYENGAHRGFCMVDFETGDTVDCNYQAGYYNGNISSYESRVSPGYNNSQYTFKGRYCYDGLDRLKERKYEGYRPPLQTRYSYHKDGRIDEVRTVLFPPTVWDYQYYDGTHRLEQITNIASGDSNFTYTPSGSMMSQNDLNIDMFYNYNEEMSCLTRPINYGRDSLMYWYNTAGQRVAKRHVYHYQDDCGSGEKAFGGDEGTDDFKRKDFGSLQSKPYPGTDTSSSKDGGLCWYMADPIVGYYWFGDNMLSRYDGPGEENLKGNYLFANGERVAYFADSSADVRYYMTDHLGSVMAIVRNDGTRVNWSQFLPFGDVFKDYVYEHDVDVYHFTGHENDQELGCGLSYLGSRYYHPKFRVFTQVDPQHQRYPSLSPYSYCANNPLKYIDKKGEALWLVAAAAAAAYYLLATPEIANAPTYEGDIYTPTLGEKVLQQAGAILGAASVAVGTNALLGQIGKTAATANATAVETKANVALKGAQNTNVSQSIKAGKKAHNDFKTMVEKKPGWKSEPSLKDPKTGKTVKPDAVSPNGRPYELKPNTKSGNYKGNKQIKKYERATGKKGKVITYEPIKYLD